MYARVPQAMAQIVPYHGANPNTRNGARLRSPFPIMAPVCTSEFFKKLKLHEPLRRVQFLFLKNSQVQINSKLNEKNRMITY